MASKQEIEDRHRAIMASLPSAERRAKVACYCEENALDFKGPCGNCRSWSVLRYLSERGGEVLATEDPNAFHLLAEEYLEGCTEYAWAIRPDPEEFARLREEKDWRSYGPGAFESLP
jgi:hypothetical protein